MYYVLHLNVFSGLWYARQGRERAEREANSGKNLPSISMNANQVHNVGRTLNSLDVGEGSGQSQPPYRDDPLGQEWDQRLSSIKKLHFDDGEFLSSVVVTYNSVHE